MERDSNRFDPLAAASALIWWSDAGVDTIIDEEPRNWLRPKTGPAAPLPAPAESGDSLPGQLDLFQAYLRESDRLSFASSAAPRVCPSGDPASGLMMMIDMPAGEDCTTGTLLSGEAGTLFDRMLAAIGRDRGSIYLASLSCVRSPDGRLAGKASADCAALARHHIGLVAPKALLLFGDASSKALLGLSVAQARGRWHEVATHAGPIRAIVTMPPHYLLQQPKAKAHVWADLQMLMQGFDE